MTTEEPVVTPNNRQAAIELLQAAQKAEEAPVEHTEAEPAAADAAATPETPVEEPKAEEKPEEPKDKLSKSWAMVSRLEAEVRRQKKEVAAQLAEIERSRKEIEDFNKVKEVMKADPVAFMDQQYGPGWYQQATERFLKDSSGKMPAEDRVARLEAELKSERENREKWFDEQWELRAKKYQEQQQHQNAAGQYISELNKLVASDERFELTRVTPGGTEAVIELVEGHLKQFNKLLSVEEAATLVEQELELQAENLLKAQKLRAKLGSQALKQATTTPTKAPSGIRTLTDNLSASGTPAYKPSQKERRDEAVKLLRRLRSEGVEGA